VRYEGDRAPKWRLLPEGNGNGPQTIEPILPHLGNLIDGHGDASVEELEAFIWDGVAAHLMRRG